MAFGAMAHAQQTVYTNEGKQVMLMDNGTWKYLAQNNSNTQMDEDKNIQRAGYVKGSTGNNSTSTEKSENIVYNNKGEKVVLKSDFTWTLSTKNESGGKPK